MFQEGISLGIGSKLVANHLKEKKFETSLVLVKVNSFAPCYRSLAVGKKSGYKLFSLSSVEKLDQIYDNGM